MSKELFDESCNHIPIVHTLQGLLILLCQLYNDVLFLLYASRLPEYPFMLEQGGVLLKGQYQLFQKFGDLLLAHFLFYPIITYFSRFIAKYSNGDFLFFGGTT